MGEVRLGILPWSQATDWHSIESTARRVEELGYDHLVIFDHVLGADSTRPEGWTGTYDHRSPFHEPLVVYGYLAAITKRLRLATAVLVLPQRQTALVAKQAAAVDVLSRGRVILGVGIGWNKVEYQALGMRFTDRGKRIEEQIAVLRALWTQEAVDFHGRWHHISNAGLNPLPIQRPIPLWLGGGRPGVEAVIERIGRLADGWFPQFAPDDVGRATLERMHGYARAAGRDPASIGIEGRVSIANSTPDTWAQHAEDWGSLGATHLSVNTMRAELQTPDAHIAALEKFYATVHR